MSGGIGGGLQQLARGGVRWWRRRSNYCAAAEEKQLRNEAMEDGGRRQVGVFIFSFLGGVKSYLDSYLANPIINVG